MVTKTLQYAILAFLAFSCQTMAQTESNIEENVVSATIEEISACNPSEEDMQLSETLDNVQEELILLEAQLGRAKKELAFIWVFLVVMFIGGTAHLLTFLR